ALARSSGSGSLAEAPEQIGEPLCASRRKPLGELVILGAQQVVVERTERDLLHAPAFPLGAPPQRLRLLVAEPKGHRHSGDDTAAIPRRCGKIAAWAACSLCSP